MRIKIKFSISTNECYRIDYVHLQYFLSKWIRERIDKILFGRDLDIIARDTLASASTKSVLLRRGNTARYEDNALRVSKGPYSDEWCDNSKYSVPIHRVYQMAMQA